MGKLTLQTALTLNAAGFGKDLDNAEKDVKEFANVLSTASKETIRSFKDISTMGIGEMKKNLRELSQISFAGKSKEEIAAINKQIGTLRDTMGDLRAQQNIMGTELGSALTKGLQTISAMAQVGVGVATLFGASAEQAKKYEAVMIQLIGVTQALGVVEDAISTGQLRNIALRIQATAVTTAQTVATQAATAAQWLYNTSLLVVIGTLGAVVLAVGAVVTGIYLLVTARNKDEEAIQKQIQANKDLQQSLSTGNTLADKALRLMKARGASAQELKQFELNFAQVRLNTIKAQMDADEKAFVNGFKSRTANLEATKLLNDQYNETKDNVQILSFELENMGKTSTTVMPKMTKDVTDNANAWQKDLDMMLQAIEYKEMLMENRDKSPIVPLVPKGITQGSGPLQKRPVDEQTAFSYALTLSNTKLSKQINLMQNLNELMGGFGQAATDAFGKESAASKAFAIGQVLTSAAVAVMGTWAAYTKYGTIGLGMAIAQTAMIGAIASAQTAKIAGAFAQGGIVGGSSYYGDQLVAKVNSKEMILNESQQSRLFALANGAGGSGGEVTFRIQGSELVGVLTNYGRKVKNTH